MATSEKLGRHRQVIERSLTWLTGCRSLILGDERSARLFAAFLTPRRHAQLLQETRT